MKHITSIIVVAAVIAGFTASTAQAEMIRKNMGRAGYAIVNVNTEKQVMAKHSKSERTKTVALDVEHKETKNVRRIGGRNATGLHQFRP